jgi:hypothetical protein
MSEYGSEGQTGDEGRPADAAGHGFVPPSTPHDAGAASPFDVTPGADDVIGSPDNHKPRRAPVLLAMVAVLAVVLAAGAVAFVKSSATAGSALTKLVPAGSYGYVQLDLRQSSSAGLFGYLSHFPGSPATKPDASKATFRDTLLGTVFTATDTIDYARDIQPWLGNAAGIALFRGTGGNPVPLVVIATSDAAKAKDGLARIHQADSSFAYDIVDGDVLLAQKQADLDDAQSQAKSGALPSSGTYAADVATLPSGSLVTLWADLDKITAAAKSAMAKACVSAASLAGGCSVFNNFSQLGILGGLGGAATSSGRIALGVSVADKVATLTVRELGHKASASGPTIGDGIKALPADTTGAIALGNVSTGLTRAMTSLGPLSGLLFGLGSSMAYSSSSSAVASAAASTQALSSDVPMVASSLAPGVVASAMVAIPAPAFPSGMPSAYAMTSGAALPSVSPGMTINSSMPDPTKVITDSLKAATGLSFPDDFTAVLGDRSVIAVGDVPLSSGAIKDLQVGIRSHPQDIAKAQTLGQTLIQHLEGTGIPFQLGTKTVGGDLVLASSQSYADTLAGTGKLGDSPQFTAAMGDLSSAHFAAYVDLSKFTGILGATRDKMLSGFKALGIVERMDGADAVIQLKLIAG